MTRYVLRRNPSARTEADPLFLVHAASGMGDTRALIGAVYHAYASWSYHGKDGRPLIEGQSSLRALRVAMREHSARNAHWKG